MSDVTHTPAVQRGYVDISKEHVIRFWREVDVTQRDGFWAVQLDGRALKTPAKHALKVPTRAAAQMIADEWIAQDRVVDPASMPATRLASTAIDHVGGARQVVADEIAAYAGSDAICYLGEGALQRRQIEEWAPWRAWAARELGVELEPVVGVAHRAQSEASLARVKLLALELDDFQLTGLAAANALFGSAVLALAVLKGAMGGEEAFDLSRLEDAFQQSQWGVDAEAAERAATMRQEAVVLERWLRALEE
ncbi:ATP12 family protein [Brevundimonas sp.]|uniref:ATP12 family chaperone protein n=1 Tax=Brevundimonas sp. TaxID=1871086 RepID=UPI00198DBC3E|nr:ATP12 family protein [Brevundimonas sp.]MBD3836980.1 ATPase [Brevundimonas sp.]